MTEVPVIPGGTPKWTRDATTNDSDKTFTVPAGKRWVLLAISAALATTATVGNRVLRCDIGNGTNVIWYSAQTAAIVASKNGTLHMVPSIAVSATAVSHLGANGNAPDIGIQDWLPPFTLPAGYTIRIWDTAAIDAAADDLTVVLHYIEYEA